MMENLQDVYSKLDQLGYAPSTYRDVETHFRQTPGFYGVASLHDIPVDLDAFDRLWRNRTDALLLGFGTVRGFKLWRTHIRGAMKRALGLGPVSKAERETDAWQIIAEHLEETGPENRCIKLLVLMQRARRHRLEPTDIDNVWIAQQHASYTSSHRSSFRSGVRLLNELIATRDTHSRIRDLLPLQPFQLPETQVPKPFGGLELPDSFHRDLEAFGNWLRQFRRGDLDDLDDVPAAAELGRNAIARDPILPYRDAVSWIVRELVADDVLKPDEIEDLSVLLDPERIRQAAKRFRARRNDGAYKEHGSTLHSYIGRLIVIAKKWAQMPAQEIEKLRRIRHAKTVKTRNVGRISKDREDWLRDLVCNDKSPMRDAVLTMPGTLMARADRIHAHWASTSQLDRQKALHYAAAAAFTAILLHTMALRKKNLRHLRFRGVCPTLIVQTRTRCARLDIPADEVKNKRHLEAPVPAEAWQILKRWLEVYRPLLVDQQRTGQRYVDSVYVFPGVRADTPISNSTFDRIFKHGVRELGIGMTPHMARHAIAALVLKRDPNMLNTIADFLGDTPATVKNHYTFLDTHRASEDSQSIIKRESKKAHKRQALRARRSQ